MNKKIIFGSLLSVFIIFILPSVPAVEYNATLESNELGVINEIKCKDIKDFEERFKNIDHEELKERIKNSDLRELKEKIQNIDINSVYKELKVKLKDYSAEPKFIIISLVVIRVILTLIRTIVNLGYTILIIILDSLYTIIKIIIGVPVVILIYILNTIISIVDLILATIFDIIIPGSNAAKTYN